MKSKAFTYILLIAVAIIWYQVFFRVKNNLLGEESIIPNQAQTKAVLTPFDRDTFQLMANYRDPFDDRGKPVRISIDNNDGNDVKRPIKQNKTRMVWPSLKYYGIVRRTTNTSPIAIIKIDDILLQVRKGEELLDGIILKSIWRDSVLVQKAKSKKILKR